MSRKIKGMRVGHFKTILCLLIGLCLFVLILKSLWKTETKITNMSLATKADLKVYAKHVEFGAGENRVVKSREFNPGPMKKRVVVLNLCDNQSFILDDILVRFGANNNLSVSLYPPNADLSLTKESDVGSDIVIYNSLLAYPKRSIRDDAVRFTILQNPLDRIINDPNILDKMKRNKQGEKTLDGVDVSHSSNIIARSLGLNTGNGTDTHTNIASHLKSVGKKVGIVLLQERIKETLILMKRVLNWSLSDILFFHKDELNLASKLSQSTKDRIRSENHLDVMIYEYFEQLFESQLKDMGSDFQEELVHFEIILTEFLGYCYQKYIPDEPFPIEATVWDKELFIPWQFCEMLKMSRN